MVDTVLELAVPARFPQVSALRHAADAFLQATVPDGDTRFQMLLVISELCTNAIEAAHNPRSELTLRVRDGENSTVIEVEDVGPGFPTGAAPEAEDDDERGRGLIVVRSLVEDMSVTRRGDRTIVRCVLRKN